MLYSYRVQSGHRLRAIEWENIHMRRFQIGRWRWSVALVALSVVMGLTATTAPAGASLLPGVIAKQAADSYAERQAEPLKLSIKCRDWLNEAYRLNGMIVLTHDYGGGDGTGPCSSEILGVSRLSRDRMRSGTTERLEIYEFCDKVAGAQVIGVHQAGVYVACIASLVLYDHVTSGGTPVCATEPPIGILTGRLLVTVAWLGPPGRQVYSTRAEWVSDTHASVCP
jgi:hypothetical protein